MKTQMRFQKYLCLAMLIVGALALVYAFCYSSGALSELGYVLGYGDFTDYMTDTSKNSAQLYADIQGFNDALMYCAIVMILLAAILYITSCNKRRNYYITNYVATGACAGGNIIMSIILIALNAVWRSRFLNVDFKAWNDFNEFGKAIVGESDTYSHYYESTLWFDIGFVVYLLVIIASVLLILNLVWKIKLMQGEKKLLNGSGANIVEGGTAV